MPDHAHNEADRREFPAPIDQFPARAEKFAVPNRTGNLPQRIGIAGRIEESLAEEGSRWPGVHPCGERRNKEQGVLRYSVV
jgi:hypothetical protein